RRQRPRTEIRIRRGPGRDLRRRRRIHRRRPPHRAARHRRLTPTTVPGTIPCRACVPDAYRLGTSHHPAASSSPAPHPTTHHTAPAAFPPSRTDSTAGHHQSHPAHESHAVHPRPAPNSETPHHDPPRPSALLSEAWWAATVGEQATHQAINSEPYSQGSCCTEILSQHKYTIG